MCPSDFSSFSIRLLCYLLKGPLKRDFLNIYITTSFEVRKSKNTSAMMVIFFLIMFKIESKIRKCKKKLENVFCFWDNWIWKCCYKLSRFRRKYLLSPVNGLTKSPKILISSQESINMVKVLPFSCGQCFSRSTMLLGRRAFLMWTF